jgi:hypothetical protein
MSVVWSSANGKEVTQQPPLVTFAARKAPISSTPASSTFRRDNVKLRRIKAL